MFFDEQLKNAEIVIKPVSNFDIYEVNIRRLLKGAAIFLAILSGIVAIYASKYETNSLWYSMAVFIAGSALTEISYFGAGVFLIVCLVLIMTFRNWRLSKA